VDGQTPTEPCRTTTLMQGVNGAVRSEIGFLQRDGDLVQILVNTRFIAFTETINSGNLPGWDSDRFAGDAIWVSPGKSVTVQIAGFGPMKISGKFYDWMPINPTDPDATLDPGPNALRIVSPILVRNHEVLFKALLSSSATDGKSPDPAFELYLRDQ